MEHFPTLVSAPGGDIHHRPHTAANRFIIVADIFTYSLNIDTDIFKSRCSMVVANQVDCVYFKLCFLM